jgi:hypothetical protein
MACRAGVDHMSVQCSRMFLDLYSPVHSETFLLLMAVTLGFQTPQNGGPRPSKYSNDVACCEEKS